MDMQYGKSLYQPNDTYKVFVFNSKEEWLQARQDLHGIGGSDASAVFGLNPWKTNRDLWKQKTGRMESPSFEPNERIEYGTDAEEHLRRLFQLKHRNDYNVQYFKNALLQNIERPYMLYSPDGLISTKDGKRGILEIKTSWLMKSTDRDRWYDRENKEFIIPDNYYIQIIHGLNVTKFDFVDLYAELIHSNGNSEIVQYHIERERIWKDAAYVRDGIAYFWKSVEEDREPALILPEI